MSRTRVSFGAIAAALGACVLIAGIWALTVVLSGPAGSGQVHKDQNNAKNRELWSATYNTDWYNLQADKANIGTLFDMRNQATATKQDEIDLTGAVINCAADIGKYNSDAQNTLGAQWLPSGLPTSVNISDYCDTTNLK